MGFFQRIRSLFGSDVSANGAAMMSAIFPAGIPPRRGSKELLMAYRTMPWLHAAVQRIGENVAGTCWRLYRSRTGSAPQQRMLTRDAGGRYLMPSADEVLQHPFLDLLRKPNPVLKRLPFWSIVSGYLDIKGEAPIIIERGDDGLPIELWPTPPHWLIFTPSANDPNYQFLWNAWRRNVPETDVINLVHPDLENPYARGSGIAQALADELDIDEFATKHVAAYFYNRAMPDVFISMKGVKDGKVAEEWEEKIRNKYRGSNRAWQMHVTNADIEVKSVAQNFKDLTLNDLRTIQRDTVLQVFGVPPEVMGIVENSNRATIGAADFLFTSKVLVPRLNFLAAALTDLVADEYDERLFVAYESPVAEDLEFALKVMIAQPSLFTKNEWRGLGRKPPIDGWDEEFGTATPGAAPGALPGAPAPSALPGQTAPVLEPENPTPDAPEVDDDDDDEDPDGKSAPPKVLRLPGGR